jgi:UDP-2,4-diacetamido-2,4,6-trideoxy-beta-L-altropyranose hydrolase
MRVIFRVDASSHVGAGHLMRCLSLADALMERNAKVSFVCRETPGNLVEQLSEKSIPVVLLPPLPFGSAALGSEELQFTDARQTIAAMGGLVPDWLVVDHYGLGLQWECLLRQHVAKILSIDDLPSRPHNCDVLLDQNYAPTGNSRYSGLVPANCEVLLGPAYALLKKDFRLLHEESQPGKTGLNRVLIFFTAGNDQGETLKAMTGVFKFKRLDAVDVVIGQSNADREAIENLCALYGWGFHCQVNYMPRLIAQADLVIGAGGSSNWERCALGVPAVVTILAENQLAIAHDLAAAGVVDNLGWNTALQPEDYALALGRITPTRLAQMSELARAMVDARGAQRLAELMFQKR